MYAQAEMKGNKERGAVYNEIRRLYIYTYVCDSNKKRGHEFEREWDKGGIGEVMG